MIIKKAINHFVEFHKGTLNIILHIIGFAGIFYSIYTLNWVLFAISLVVVEAGHIYNHFAGIKAYETSLSVSAWRLLIFSLAIMAFYLLTQF